MNRDDYFDEAAREIMRIQRLAARQRAARLTEDLWKRDCGGLVPLPPPRAHRWSLDRKNQLILAVIGIVLFIACYVGAVSLFHW